MKHDPQLLAALRHAPDAQDAPPQAVSEAILAAARAQARGVEDRRSRVAPAWTRWLLRLQQPAWAGGAAAVVLSVVIASAWWASPETAPVVSERRAAVPLRDEPAPAASASVKAPAAEAVAPAAPTAELAAKPRASAKAAARPTAPAPAAPTAMAKMRSSMAGAAPQQAPVAEPSPPPPSPSPSLPAWLRPLAQVGAGRWTRAPAGNAPPEGPFDWSAAWREDGALRATIRLQGRTLWWQDADGSLWSALLDADAAASLPAPPASSSVP